MKGVLTKFLAATVLFGALLANPAAADPGDEPSAGPAGTTGGAEPQSMAGTVSPNVAAPGESIAVQGTGWPAATQVQAVVCGDLAIGGSSACAQESAALGYVNDDGLTELSVVVSAPPKPCPCVVRLSSYNGPVAAVDIPLVVTGHPVGTPPSPILPAALLTVTDVELRGDAGFAAWFGASPTKQILITVRNDGAAVAVGPELTVGVGKAQDPEAQPLAVDEISLEPGQTKTVTVDVSLPFAAFGDYNIVGRVGPAESGEFATDWASYPWGLVFLNVLGALLLAWGIRRRLEARRTRHVAARAGVEGIDLGATPGLDRPYVLPDVVYVSELGGFLVSPKVAGRSGLLKRVAGRLELQDLAGLGALTASGTPILSLPSTAAAGGVEDAVVDITALDTHLARRSGLAGGPGSSTDDPTGSSWVPAAGRRKAAPHGPSGKARGTARMAARRTARRPAVRPSVEDDSVVDLAAADAWLARTMQRVRK